VHGGGKDRRRSAARGEDVIIFLDRGGPDGDRGADPRSVCSLKVSAGVRTILAAIER